MLIKNIDFNQPVKLLINDEEYDFDYTLQGTQKAFNKGHVSYKNVIKKGATNDEIMNGVFRLPKFSRIEHYYGDQLFFLGFVKSQNGTLNPRLPKTINLKVMDGKDWLTQSELMDKVFVNASYETVVDYVINKLQLPFIKKGKMQFSNNGIIEGWDSEEVDAYSVLRFIERQSGTLLQITLEPDKTYAINFFSKAEIGNPDGNAGTPMNLSNENEYNLFDEAYKLINIDWKQTSQKDFNNVRVTSEKIRSTLSIQQEIDLTTSSNSFPLSAAIANFDKSSAVLLDGDKKEIRKLSIRTNDDINNGRRFDIAFSPENNVITISEKLLKTNQYLRFKFFPIRRGTVQFENVKDQEKIAVYTKGTGKKARFEKHNDAGNTSQLIKYSKHYLELGLEEKMDLTIELNNPPWNVGEHVICTFPESQKTYSGIYYVKNVRVNFTNYSTGNIFQNFIYTLTKTSDFEDHLNFYDDQSYRQKPVVQSSEVRDTFDNIPVQINVKVEKAVIECIDSTPSYLEEELEASFADEVPSGIPESGIIIYGGENG